MKPIRIILSSLILLSSAAALAQTPAQNTATIANQEVQLKSDQAGLSRAKDQLKADKATLKENTKNGVTTAESADAKDVRQGQRNVKGLKKVISTAEPGMQKDSDKAALKVSKKKLKADKKKLKKNKKAGKMSSQSKDSQAVYKDEQSVKAQVKTIKADKAELNATEKK
ncbi:MAG: hypothetical protein JWP36_2387 [Paucimonas sp.]|nr:hypothetical protein [Paucimonas sp.]